MGVEVVMAFTVKATAISPKPFDIGKLEAEIGKALTEEGKRDAKTLGKTTEGWSSAPPMGYTIELRAKEASVWMVRYLMPALLKYNLIDFLSDHFIRFGLTRAKTLRTVSRFSRETRRRFAAPKSNTISLNFSTFCIDL